MGANIGSTIEILCSIEAYPRPTKFSWFFNNSKESYTIENHKYSNNSSKSILTHKVLSNSDFGHLYCTASNVRGVMEAPCLFSIVPATHPESPFNCQVINQTAVLLQVECEPGLDGGLDQSFHIQVVDSVNSVVISNVSSLMPQFKITGLSPGRDIKLNIWAENKNGKSSLVILEDFNSKVAQLQIGKHGLIPAYFKKLLISESPVPLKFTPFLGILAGIVLTFIVILLIIVMIIRLKYKYNKQSSTESLKAETEVNTKCRSFNFENNASVSTNIGSSDCSRGKIMADIFLHHSDSKNPKLRGEYSDQSVIDIHHQSFGENVRTQCEEIFTGVTVPCTKHSVNPMWAPLLQAGAPESDI